MILPNPRKFILREAWVILSFAKVYGKNFANFFLRKTFCSRKFLLLKYYVHDDTDAFFLFLLQKDFDICLGPFFAFCLFLLQKDFDIFRVPLFEAFLCFFDNSYLSFLYIEKNYKKIIYWFFCMSCYVSYMSIFNFLLYQNQKKSLCRT